MNQDIVDAELYIEALKEQRNQAQDRHAVAMARLVASQREVAELRAQVVQLLAAKKEA